MYVIVNSDLGMGKGKIAAQCCHAACHVTRILERNQRKCEKYTQWLKKDGETKVVLRATQAELQKVLDQFEVDRVVKRENNEKDWCVAVHDAGRTQIPAGSLTCIAFKPTDRAPTEIEKLKLL